MAEITRVPTSRRNAEIVRLRITTTTPVTRDAVIRSAPTMHPSRALTPRRVRTRRQIAVTRRQAAAITAVADTAAAALPTAAVADTAVADTAVAVRVEAVPLRAIAPVAVAPTVVEVPATAAAPPAAITDLNHCAAAKLEPKIYQAHARSSRPWAFSFRSA